MGAPEKRENSALVGVRRGWPNLVLATCCLVAFFADTGDTQFGMLAALISDWPHYEIFGMLVVPAMAVPDRPWGATAMAGTIVWVGGWTIAFAVFSDAPRVTLVFLLLYVAGRVRAHGSADGDEGVGDVVSMVPVFVVVLVGALVCGLLFAGLFGEPIAYSAEFHDPERMRILQWRDYILASGFFYFVGCAAFEGVRERWNAAATESAAAPAPESSPR